MDRRNEAVAIPRGSIYQLHGWPDVKSSGRHPTLPTPQLARDLGRSSSFKEASTNKKKAECILVEGLAIRHYSSPSVC